MKKVVILIVLIMSFILGTPSTNATVLSTAFSNCTVGTVCEVTGMIGLNTALLDSGGGHHILEYSDKGTWNEKLKQVMFCGQGHITTSLCITYNDATNTWTSYTPSWYVPSGFMHAYQHNAINPWNGAFYVRKYGASTIWRNTIGTTTWSESASNADVGTQCCGALEFFPPLGQVWHIGLQNGSFGSIRAYNHATNTWSSLGLNNTYSMGNYQNVAVYNPQHKIMVFGGGQGSTNLWWAHAGIDTTTNAVAAVTNAPCGINVSTTIFTVDPVSGKYLLLCSDGSSRTLDMAASTNGTWSSNLGISWPFYDRTGSANEFFGTIAIPVSSYGGVLFLTCGGTSNCQGSDSPRAYVYRHQDATTFQTKCMNAGVLYCEGFDANKGRLRFNINGSGCTAAGLGQNYTWSHTGQTSGNSICNDTTLSVAQYPEIDTTTKQSGSGSLKLTILTRNGTASGSFEEPFKRIGNGKWLCISPSTSCISNTVYMQFYQRFNQAHVDENYLCTGGECGGWKHMIWFGNPPLGSSSSSIEVTHNNGWQRGVPQMYGQQGSDDYGIQDVRGCPYKGSGYSTRSLYAADPDCILYVGDTWMEFTVKLTVNGSSGSNAATSRVEMWVNGSKAIDFTTARINWNETCTAGNDGCGVGSFVALPYMTNKDGSETHPTGTLHTDNVIVSLDAICMVGEICSGVSGGDTTPPLAPTGLTVR